MAEAYPTPLAGQRLTAALLRSMQAQVARKTADTGRSATTTTTPDPHLQFDLVANAVYVWDGWIKYSSDTGADFNVDFTIPTGTLGEWTGFGAGNPVTGASPTPTLRVDLAGPSGYLIRTESNDVSTPLFFGGLGTGNSLCILLNGTLRTAATAGTFSLDWAQNASQATTTTVFTDSWLRMQRIA